MVDRRRCARGRISCRRRAAKAARRNSVVRRDQSATHARRIHFDLARWYDATATPQLLPQLARAVWDQRKIRIDYTSWTARTKRDVDPFGLVLKNATWYLIGRHVGKIRTYRVSEIASLEMLEATFTVPDDFDLPAYWDASKARFEDSPNE